jgi:hypothetical protein
MVAERSEPTMPASEMKAGIVRLSDGSEHESQAAADAYKAENYPESWEAEWDVPVGKLITGGTAATIGLAGIYLVAKRHMKKES